jgi:hypothetical protein
MRGRTDGCLELEFGDVAKYDRVVLCSHDWESPILLRRQ